MLTHRRHQNSLTAGDVLLFCESDKNEHYGSHVWELASDLPPVDDRAVTFAMEFYSIGREEAAELVNPSNIVDNAGAWDDRQFVSDFWAEHEVVGYRTQDGAVVLDRESVELSYREEVACE